MIARLTTGATPRGLLLLALLLAGALIAPIFAGDYLLTLLILILYFAYTGQAWNIMMGFAGQLSLGHALYVGLGAYTAAALYVHFGIGPWLGLLAAVPIAASAGAFIGFHLAVIVGLLPTPLMLYLAAIVGALVVLWLWRGR